MKSPLAPRTSLLLTLFVTLAGTAIVATSARAAGEPTITVQPQSQTLVAGTTLSLSVTATGSPAPTYQWRKNGSAISGATRAAYEKPNIQAPDAGTYTVQVSNNKGNVTSRDAVLTVNAPEPLVLNLWPNTPPGDVGIAGPERSFMYDSDLVGLTKLVTDVSTPTLTVYHATTGKAPKTAVVICPGGGFHALFWELEGEEVAAWLNSIGITAVILKYRVPRREGDLPGQPPLGPLHDAQRAVSLVRSRAAQWDIDPGRIGMMGFSVGGHLTLATATRQRSYAWVDPIDDVSCAPNFATLCYAGLWPEYTIPPSTPPVMLLHASDDSIATSEYSANAYLALKRGGIPAELHIYGSGEHDFGVRQNGKLPSTWTQLFVFWLRSLNLLTPQ